MSKTGINKRVIATLKMPVSVPEFIIYVRGLILKLTGNVHVPLPYPALVSTLATCNTNINALEHAQAVVQTHVSGSRSLRDTALEISKRDVRSIHLMVQTIADNNVSDAVMIIQSAGFGTKTVGGSVKKVFGAKNTLVSGTVKVFAPGIPRSDGAHNWFYASDLVDFSDKTEVPTTTKATAIIGGLVPYTKYAFFHVAITPQGIENEEGPKFLMVI